ncbi:LysR family transcriptional regulator [Citrobacter koseri]|uniref:LysR family transcriptional regulator n=1 Tax=Citrobacter koseri TaxID=545 RepID=UPI0028BE4BAA|nr:LysR family transcriptional regulator [Citrobacter koseri]MDT7459951.1 LysR family transcriptional regulator [Citrobacter koseri]
MELSELKAFMATVDAGSVTQAARLLHRTQSSISLRIKQLEHKVGVPLLERRNDGVSPTIQGQLLYAYTKKIFSLIEEVEEKIHAEGHYREIRLGIITSLPTAYIQSILDKAGIDKIEVDIIQGSSQDLADMLNKGELDIAIIGSGMVAASNNHIHLYTDDMVIVSSIERVDMSQLSELKDDIFLVSNKKSASSRNLNLLLSCANIRPKRIIECGSYPVLFASIIKNKGVSLVPRSLAVAFGLNFSIKIHKLSGDFTPFDIVLSYAKNYEHPLLLQLINDISSFFKELKKPNPNKN